MVNLIYYNADNHYLKQIILIIKYLNNIYLFYIIKRKNHFYCFLSDTDSLETK